MAKKQTKTKKENIKEDFSDLKNDPDGLSVKINKKRDKTQRIVIVGGGFAGVRACLDLLRKQKNIHITLIDKNGYHSYHPDFYEIASAVTGELSEACDCEDLLKLKQTAAIPFETIFKKYKNITILKDEAKNIDFNNSFVFTDHGQKIFYDFLLLSAGSETNFYGNKELKETSFEFKTVENTLNIRCEVNEVVLNKAKKDKIKIVIVGGGFSGSELAGELACFTKHLFKKHIRPKDSAEIKIIEGGSTLLSGTSVWARNKSIKRLKKLGVEIILNSPVKRIEKSGKIYFNLSDGKKEISDNFEEFDMLIWTAGVAGSSLSNIFPAQIISKKSTLNANEYLEILPFKNVIAAGDIANTLNNNSPIPMTAQKAINEGKYAAYIISKKIRGVKKFKPYKPKQNKFIIPLGGKYAVADLGFIKFSGFFAWSLKHIVTLTYFLSILPTFYAIHLWLKGIKIYIKND